MAESRASGSDDSLDRTERVAIGLFERALRDEQAVHLLSGDDDASAIRRAVRRLARHHGTAIRTGIVDDDVLAVIRLDAALWNEPARVMREKLSPAPSPSTPSD